MHLHPKKDFFTTNFISKSFEILFSSSQDLGIKIYQWHSENKIMANYIHLNRLEMFDLTFVNFKFSAQNFLL